MEFALPYIITGLLTVMSPQPGCSGLAQRIAQPEVRAWADSVYNTLSDHDRVAQLMIPHISPQGQGAEANIDILVGREHVGGLLFSKGTAQEFAAMTNYAQDKSALPLLMTLDGEWGPAMRVTDAQRFPHNMALGAIQDADLLYDYGRETARQCRELGIHVNFAPVLDVNSNPDNPVIGYRSFGEDPARVGLLGIAYSLGLEDGGVMAVAKHFPGHGDTDADSHKALPIINHTLDTLRQVDLAPFRRFFDAGCSGVMVAHIAVPALDAAEGPASMSRLISTGCLKDDLRFEGLVFTDGLGMKGAEVKGNKCVQALIAGADMLLSPPNAAADIRAVLQAIDDGLLSWDDIEQRCKKVLAYKRVLCATDTTIDTANIALALNAPSASDVCQRLADAALVVARNNAGLLPINDLAHKRIALVNIGTGPDNEFAHLCRRYADIDILEASNVDPSQYDIIIAGVMSEGAAAQSALKSLADKAGGKLVPVMVMNHYKTAPFAGAIGQSPTLVITGDDTPQSRRSAAQALFGGIAVSGRMPVNVTGVARLGDGVTLRKTRLGYSSPTQKGMSANLTQQLDSAVYAAMADGAFPGAQLVVVKDGDIVVDRAYGRTTKGGTAVTPYTLYDLASVSKTIGTLTGLMKAYDLGLLDLDQPASQVIPALDIEGKSDITPRMLLFHETGFIPSLNMFNVMMDPDSYDGKLISPRRDAKHGIKIENRAYGHNKARMRTDIVSRDRSALYPIEMARGMYVGTAAYDTIMARIYAQPVKDSRKMVYSCLNFCTLMDLEQRLTGIPHHTWVTDSVWGPIGAYGLCYRPTVSRPEREVAATEQDNFLRRQHVQGYVHDELAAFSGGVQGNAGVFGTATDIAKVCQLWLKGGVYGDAVVFSPETTRLFTTTQSANSRRGLGFDRATPDDPDNSPCCPQAPDGVYGHTGFTGTCFWVDPLNDLVFIFLSNRVDPSRNNPAWTNASIRSTLHSLIYDSLEN